MKLAPTHSPAAVRPASTDNIVKVWVVVKAATDLKNWIRDPADSDPDPDPDPLTHGTFSISKNIPTKHILDLFFANFEICQILFSKQV